MSDTSRIDDAVWYADHPNRREPVVDADLARQLAVELTSAKAALATLLRIEEEDHCQFVERDSELGLAMLAARKVLFKSCVNCGGTGNSDVPGFTCGRCFGNGVEPTIAKAKGNS